jgi:hypothetical protein
VGYPTDADVVVARHFLEIVCCRFSLDGRVGRNDELIHLPTFQSGLQAVQPKICRADAINGRQPPKEDEVPAPKTGRALYGDYVGGAFDDAEDILGTTRALANAAKTAFGEIATLFAVTDRVTGFLQNGSQLSGAVTVPFQDVKCHSLRRFWPHTRQAAQGVDQLFEKGFLTHLKNRLKTAF